MTFFEYVPPLEQRVLSDGGEDFIKGIVHFRNRLMRPTPMRIARLYKIGDKRIQNVARALENAGYVTLEYSGPSEVKDIKLTSKGERCACEMGLNMGMMV